MTGGGESTSAIPVPATRRSRGRRIERVSLACVSIALLVLVPGTAAQGHPEEPRLTTPLLGPQGQVRMIVLPEFRDAPGLLEDLRAVGIEGLEIDLVGPSVAVPGPGKKRIPSRLVLIGAAEVVARAREVLAYLDVPRPSVVVSLLAAEVRCLTLQQSGGHAFYDRVTPEGAPDTIFRGVLGAYEPESYLRSTLVGARPFPGTSLRFGNAGANAAGGAFEYVLRLLAENGHAEFLAWPTVVCSEGVPGHIASIVTIPQYVFTEGGVNVVAGVRTEETGVRFLVTPRQISADAAVLDLQADLRFVEPELPGEESAGSLASYRRRVKTRLTVRDRESLMVGGLRLERSGHDRRGTPILVELDGINRLTSSMGGRNLDTELILLIRVRVLVPRRKGGICLPPGEARRLDARECGQQPACRESP